MSKINDLEISVDGYSFNGFIIAKMQKMVHKRVFHDLKIDLSILNVENCHNVSVTVQDDLYLPKQGTMITFILETLFTIESGDYTFLDEPENEETIEVMTDLIQVAIAHARPLMFLWAESEGYSISIPYYLPDHVRHYTKESLVKACA